MMMKNNDDDDSYLWSSSTRNKHPPGQEGVNEIISKLDSRPTVFQKEG
jgi:hypothetical protein